MQPRSSYQLEKFIQKERAFRFKLRNLPSASANHESIYGQFCDLSFEQQKQFFTRLLTESFIETKVEMDNYLIYLLNHMFENHRNYCLYLLAKIHRLAQHKRLFRPIIKHIFSTFRKENSHFKLMKFTTTKKGGAKKYCYKVIKNDKYKLIKKYIKTRYILSKKFNKI